MSEITPNQVKPWSQRGAGSRLLDVAGVLLLVLCFFSPARQVADVQLDSSNYSSYAYFTARDFQFGTEVMPMAGPYGFVPYGFVYSGHLFLKRLGLELLTKLVLGVLIVWFMRRAQGRPVLRWLWLLSLLVMAPFIDDLPYAMAILLAGLCLIERHAEEDRRSLAIACGLAAYLALLTLFKGTQTTLAIATLGLLGLQALFMRNFRRLPWMVGAYLATVVILLFAAGQNPLGLPRYLRGVLELSSGYKSAMGLEETTLTFLNGAGAVTGLELLLAILLLSRWRNPTACAGALLLAGFNFIEWKHGFVRADGHVFIFFNYACIAAPTILLFAGGPNAVKTPVWHRGLAGGLAVAALYLSLWGDGSRVVQRHYWSILMLPDRVRANLRQLTRPGREKATLDQLLTTQRSFYQLPRTQEIVKKSRIDFFGTQLGYLMLNGLNYRPRPMGGGPFNVVTPWLQDINTAFVKDPATRPDYYLVAPQTIDNRLLMQDDPGTLRALLKFYSPITSELGVVLLRARTDNSRDLPPPRPLGSQRVMLNQPITPPSVRPDEMLLVTFSLPLNLRGRIRASLYKPPEIYMDLAGEGILSPRDRRIIPNFFFNPVIVSPVLEDNTDLLTLYQGTAGKVLRQFTLHTPRSGLFATEALQVHFFAAPRPPAEPALAAQLVESLGLPITTVPPLLIESPNSPLREFGALPVQMLEPPGRIRFALTGEEREISFIYGIDPKAYIEGATDGAGVKVDLERPGRAPQQLFYQLLDPRKIAGDRGSHTAHVVLPLFPRGSTVSLRTDRGPSGDGAWDWAYFGGIRLHVRDYLPSQFPGIDRLPVNVDADNAGALRFQDEDLFMLNSPGSLIFSLRRSDKRIIFTAGLLASAYSDGGNSDGVEFTVDLRAPNGTRTRLFQKLINPRDVAADRGDRTYEVELPDTTASPGTQLILSALPGPAGNAAFDWSYVRRLRFE